MSDDWDFYPLLVDSEPASIYLDLGLARVAPIEGQSHMAYVRVLMRQPRPDGLSSSEEFNDLVVIKDSLSEFLTQSDDTVYVGRNTSGSNRDFYFTQMTLPPSQSQRRWQWHATHPMNLNLEVAQIGSGASILTSFTPHQMICRGS